MPVHKAPGRYAPIPAGAIAVSYSTLAWVSLSGDRCDTLSWRGYAPGVWCLDPSVNYWLLPGCPLYDAAAHLQVIALLDPTNPDLVTGCDQFFEEFNRAYPDNT